MFDDNGISSASSVGPTAKRSRPAAFGGTCRSTAAGHGPKAVTQQQIRSCVTSMSSLRGDASAATTTSTQAAGMCGVDVDVGGTGDQP